MFFFYICVLRNFGIKIALAHKNKTQMKKALLLVALLFTSSIILAQGKEKIKGSKIITHAIHELESFENIEVEFFFLFGDRFMHCMNCSINPYLEANTEFFNTCCNFASIFVWAIAS